MNTVLYLDDDPMVRHVVRRELEQHGLHVVTAESILEAKERIAHAELDGCFIDIWLGDGTAFDVFAWLQEFHPWLARRTAFVTGDVGSGLGSERSLQALGRPVLAKPFDIDQMVQLAHEWARAD
jgi:DNA-binding NtrC family response regulator